MSLSAAASSYNSSDLFDQNYEELGSDFFDQFLMFTPVSSETIEYSALPDLESSDGYSGRTSMDSTDDEAKFSTIYKPWQGESWAITQDEASLHPAQGNAFYAELSGRAAVSESELLSLECITLDPPEKAAHPPNSLPSSPSPSATLLERRKNRLVQFISKIVRRPAGDTDKRLLSPIRKSAPSPKMKLSQSNQSTLDSWQQKLTLDASKFSFDFEESLTPLSPTSSARVSDIYESSDSDGRKYLDGFLDNSYLSKKTARPTAYDTPLATPNLVDHHTRRTSLQQLPEDKSFFPITPQPQSVSASWSQITSSSEFSAYEPSALYPADIDAPIWWNHTAMASMTHPLPIGFYAYPQRATKSLAKQLQNDVSYSANENAFDPLNMTSGLMIEVPEIVAQQSFAMGNSPMMRQGFFAATHSQPHCNATNRQRAHALSRQPQSSSPTQKNRSGSSDFDSPSPRLIAFQERKRKSPKTTKNSTPRTRSTPAVVNFVNYTPNDSRKILTGVAPSGSSKTKARREKEALEKRRKLSQAAVRAVREAGGDIESLVEQGLFVR